MTARCDVAATVALITQDHLGLEPGEIEPGKSFIDDLAADSLDVLELIIAIESEYAIEISDDESAAIRTVADATALVLAKLGGRK